MITSDNIEKSRWRPAGLLPIGSWTGLTLFVSFVLFLVTASPSSAQIPGRWESSIVCTDCFEPAGLDFENSSTGVIALKSQQFLMPGAPGAAFSRIYVTSDGGVIWQLHKDTVYTAVLPGDHLVLRDGHLLINCWVGGTLHSNDYGYSFETFWQPTSYQLDFVAADPSTLFTLDRANFIDFDTIVVSVTRDSGRTFSQLFRYHEPEWFITSARMKDTSELWVILNQHEAYQPRMPNRLVFTTTQGRTWSEVLPWDTTGLVGGVGLLGSPPDRSESMLPGAEPGSIHILRSGSRKRGADKNDWALFDLLSSTDYGSSWRGDSSLGFRGLFLRNPAGSKLWFVLEDKQTIAYSPDNGVTWHSDSTTFKDKRITQMIWKDSVSGYVLTHTDSIVTFWKFIPEAASVEHIPTSRKYMRLVSTVASRGTLRVVAMRDLSGSLEISDVLGRVVWTGSIDAARTQETSITVPASPGVYVLRYSGRTGSQSISYVMH